MNNSSDILISLKPKYAEYIFFGAKTVELRKRKPNIDPGTRIWIYATAPVSAIRGFANVIQIKSAAPSLLWDELGDHTGISKIEFDRYFEGRKLGHAIVLSEIRLLKRSLSLKRIRELVHGFHPPQFFCYLNGTSERLQLSSRKWQRVKGSHRDSSDVSILHGLQGQARQ